MSAFYQVIYTDPACRDLDGIYSYIAFVLLSPSSAKRIVGNIRDAISSLSYMPERFAAADGLLWGAEPLRRMMVERYSIYYAVFKENLRVVVAGITHKGRRFGAEKKASA